MTPDYLDDQLELPTQVHILQSSSIASQVIKALNLDSATPVQAGKPAVAPPPDPAKETSQIEQFPSSPSCCSCAGYPIGGDSVFKSEPAASCHDCEYSGADLH